jgi:hypothetical protein
MKERFSESSVYSLFVASCYVFLQFYSPRSSFTYRYVGVCESDRPSKITNYESGDLPIWIWTIIDYEPIKSQVFFKNQNNNKKTDLI